MSDDTTTSNTSITGGNDPVYTTSLTSTIGRPPRKTYFVVQLIGVLVTMAVFLLSRRLGADIDHANLKDDARLTALVLRIGELLTTPIGFACAIFIVLGLGLLAIRGAIDGILKFLIWANVLWLIVFIGYHTMAIWLPIIQSKRGGGP
jgi:uncharacterized membrane protein YhaH (DUF805 family)